MRLTELGWDATFERHYVDAAWRVNRAPQGDQHVQPARVAIEFNQIFRVYTEDGELDAITAGRLKHRAANRAELPAVGDWVAVRKRPEEERGTIIAVLPRRSCFSRKMAGQVTHEQVVAANVDVSFIVMGLDPDFSTRRLERYLLLARESGASPVIVLTKPDLSPDLPSQVADVTAIAGDVPVHVVSPRHNQGLEQVSAYLTPGHTGALLGSSGVGKSTIINRLIGEDVHKTREVREADSRGRHATSHRQLVILPNGGLIIDTPGMRELQLWDVNGAVRETFDDIEALGGGCHFTNCRHRDEPRCAVKAAVEEERLPADRLESYLKLQAELAVLAQQQDERALLERKRQGRVGAKALRARVKEKRG
jgi:ribosome biogenesis GTPase / thiamine phosphate phosphatase